MKAAERRVGRVRVCAMDWAMRTAASGEDPMAILARAQLYEEFVLKGLPTAVHGLNAELDLPKL